MKLTAQQAEQALKAAGLADAQVVADEKDADTFDVDAILSTIDQSRLAILEPQIMSAKSEELERSITGKQLGAFRSFIAQKFGVKTADLAGLEKEKLIEKAIELQNAKYSQDTEGLRQELTNTIEQHNTVLTTKEQEWQSKLNEATKKYVDRDIIAHTRSVVDKIPKKGGDPEFLAEQVKTYAEGKYSLVYDEATKTVKLRSKDNPETPVFNAAKTKELTLEDVALEYNTRMGNLATDTRHVDPKTAMNGNVPPAAAQQPQGFQVGGTPLQEANARLLATE